MRTERSTRSIGIDTNALASSIILVCRKRVADAPTATRAVRGQPQGRVARGTHPPTARQHRSGGPGAGGHRPGRWQCTRGTTRCSTPRASPLSVREALALINQTLDEALAEQEGDFDADSRWALAWFEQVRVRRGRVRRGRDPLQGARTPASRGMVEAGILRSSHGKVRLLRPSELPADWDPATDRRLTAWEAVHHLIRVLKPGGEGAAAELAAKLGEPGRDRPRAGLPALHDLRAQEARRGGAVVQWAGAELAGDHAVRCGQGVRLGPLQGGLFAEDELES